MSARVVRFASKGELLKRSQASDMRQIVLQLEPQAPSLVGQMLALIDRNTAAERAWSFVMLSPSQNRLVVRWIRANSTRQGVAIDLWAECFCHMRMDTGAFETRFGATMPAIAEQIKITAQEYSHV